MMSEWEFLNDFADVGPLPQDIEITSLQRACLQNPDDLAPLLIYADYLGERDYFRTERRVRLLVEYMVIDGSTLSSAPLAEALAGNTSLDYHFDYAYAFYHQWLEHKPQHMDWKPRLIMPPPSFAAPGLRNAFHPLDVRRIILQRVYDKKPVCYYPNVNTNYGRESFVAGADGPTVDRVRYECTAENSMSYGEFVQWLQYRRDKILVGNSTISGFAVQTHREKNTYPAVLPAVTRDHLANGGIIIHADN